MKPKRYITSVSHVMNSIQELCRIMSEVARLRADSPSCWLFLAACGGSVLHFSFAVSHQVWWLSDGVMLRCNHFVSSFFFAISTSSVTSCSLKKPEVQCTPSSQWDCQNEKCALSWQDMQHPLLVSAPSFDGASISEFYDAEEQLLSSQESSEVSHVGPAEHRHCRPIRCCACYSKENWSQPQCDQRR